jgi:nitroimidazol reductase NimA-like FMN-containing flavoprotein (pyridoxamine 5'-phosphate oxidase superfamily)
MNDMGWMSVMRRKEKEIKDKSVMEEILRQNLVGRLGTAVNGFPYVVPMNYAYIKDKIFLHTHRDGKKIKDIQQNPKVCFEVDSGQMIEGELPCDYSWEYYSVIVQGEATLIEDKNEKLKTLQIISDKYAFGKSNKITSEMVERYNALTVIQIDINQMSGKKSPA